MQAQVKDISAHKSDDELLSLFNTAEKKEFAFSLLIKKYQERLYWHIRKMVIIHEDADDILQNTFVKAWKGLENFESKSKIYTWLYRIATNESITFLNKKKKKHEDAYENYEDFLSNNLENENYVTGDEIQTKLQKAILKLPEKQRIVFNMKYFDDLKYKEISEILGTSVGGLKSLYHYAVKNIEATVLEQ